MIDYLNIINMSGKIGHNTFKKVDEPAEPNGLHFLVLYRGVVLVQFAQKYLPQIINEYNDVGVVVGGRFVDGSEQLLSHYLDL